ncbi:MAG: LytR family transcriptional protein [Anaerolinea thermophila]|uniref:LytR family transcriptional protein n=1 Tax=Anaerolinea thermophila TaxID=167964 RepID=A0A101FXU1_9CHLR|nr:MAG: LytR family transcriptional protein [Anaerolinea thermophila]
MKHKPIRHEGILFFLLFIIMSMTGCSVVEAFRGNPDTTPEVRLLADLNPSMNVQPTPFLPNSFNINVETTPVVINDSLVPNQGAVKPAGQVNILLLGSDWRANSGYRTDVIMLISIYTKEEKVSIVSFPRDLWVTIPGVSEQRINTAQAYGGFPLTQKTFEYNFGISLDYYMMTNFNGFLSIIDNLGGIEINAAQNLTDRCDLSYAHGSTCSVGPGLATMDSETALWYVRSRYTSDDFDRTRRAQEVILGILKKVISINGVANAGEIYNTLSSSVVTDMTLGDIVPLISLTAKIINDPTRINTYAIGRSQVTSYVIPSSGANVLLPNYDAIWEVLKTALFTP